MAERLVTIGLAEATRPQRLDRLIAAELPELSRTHVQRLIADGFVQVNLAVITKPALRLAGPAQVHVRIPPAAPSRYQPEHIPLTIVYENADLLVIDKPAGMVVHPAAGHTAGTLVNAVLAHDPGLEGVGDEQRPGIVHRLDKDTSGLIIVAKTDAAHRELQRQFKERLVVKTYVALLDGHPPTDTGRIEAPIGRDPRNRKLMAIVPAQHGRAAVTEYRVTELYHHHTLVDAHPLTGRTHQLRLHFAYLQCPIAGDTVYGRRASTLPLSRHFLHAARLSFTLPGSGERLNLEAPLPPDLRRALQSLAER
ncbi:MAG: RluA family pseudouridine synthase [Anaerolineales bacterium]|nr:RluA family pseudouridine synthase [Anaerolineales bacterium]